MWMHVTAGGALMFSASLLPFRSCIKGSHWKKMAITSQYLEVKHAGKHNSLSETCDNGEHIGGSDDKFHSEHRQPL